MTTNAMTAADHIRELIRPFTSREPVTQPTRGDDGRWRTTRSNHTVDHLPLLAQIEQTVTSSGTAGEIFRAAYGSKPAGRIDCLAFLERIRRQSKAMAADLGIPNQPWTVTTPGARVPNPTTNPGAYPRWTWTRLPSTDYPRLLAISGAIGDTTNHRVKGWWATARVLTQHDGPPYSPAIPCPEETCERWGTIRARVSPDIAVCVECHHVWTADDGTFGRLAIWAQWAAEHLRGPRHWRTDDDATGYPGLGYKVECEECAPERLAMAVREAERLSRVRPTRPQRVVA